MKVFDKLNQFLYDHGPDIKIVGGVGLIVAGTVLACKKTYHVDEVLGYIPEKAKQIKTARKTLDKVKYSDRKFAEDCATLAVNATKSVTKQYWMPTLMVVGGVLMVCNGRKQYSERLSGALAGYAFLKKQYDNFRNKAEEKYGSEAVRSLETGAKQKVVRKTEKDPETGKNKTVTAHKWILESRDEATVAGPGDVWFGPDNHNYTEGNPALNLVFLKGKQEEIQRQVDKHRVSLDQVYDVLGIPEDRKPKGNIGLVFGWRKGAKVDFGLTDDGGAQVFEFMDSDPHEEFLLTFHNVEPLMEK